MDAPSTVFEIHAGGVDRSILVTGLTPDPEPGPDAAALAAFADLVARLRTVPTADYLSDGVVALIAETEAAPGDAAQPGHGPTSRRPTSASPPRAPPSRSRHAC
jgi:hypothetical protein